VVGDLAFFYDLNALGNHYIKNNIRILLVNNGEGIEFKNYLHPAFKFGDAANEYFAARRDWSVILPVL
jgi:2-succinyl-5-enolpyruvyl-6-hydroxy-3-cyclohexene-1-carboxylate synthase